MPKKRPYSFLEKNVGKNLGKYVDPNILSFISFLMMCVSSFFYIKNKIILGGISILIAGVFDALDGTIARALKKYSFADKYFDKLGETLMTISLSYFNVINPVVGIFLSLVCFQLS
ncbi:MAG: CDP-alcohol phosphatidyltransferase family protein [Candidatus Aenigmarchaeota archaeon]|nr:CDP-alcohol phosphatidyltransferase family protein [Candidatus Aenigmarchaeota archaeon]